MTTALVILGIIVTGVIVYKVYKKSHKGCDNNYYSNDKNGLGSL